MGLLWAKPDLTTEQGDTLALACVLSELSLLQKIFKVFSSIFLINFPSKHL